VSKRLHGLRLIRIFVEVVRKHIDGLPQDVRGWFLGLKDRHIGLALPDGQSSDVLADVWQDLSCKLRATAGFVQAA
jgi:hypothetical protein